MRLAAPKSLLPFDLEDERNLDPGSRLDFVIAICKPLFEAPRDLPANGGLSGAHHADQVDVVAGLHARDCSSPPPDPGPKRKGRLAPALVIVCADAQRSVNASLRIFGVMNTRSSVLLSRRSVFLNRKPTYGRSPKKGTLLTTCPSSWV